MANDPGMDLIYAFLQDKRIEAAIAYAERGREHVALPPDEVGDQWVAEFRAWAAASEHDTKFDRRRLDDLESELFLQGLDPPINKVPDEFAILTAASGRRVDRVRADPQKFTKFAKRVDEEVEAFKQQFSDKTKRS